MTKIADLTRPEMRDIALQLITLLQARADEGPPEPGLDAFIPELTAVGGRLGVHVGGQVLADAARRAQLARLEVADDDVDAWLRHSESFVYVESIRRTGGYIAATQALHEAAFPDGVEPASDHVPDENRYCRKAIQVLSAPEHHTTLVAIKFPLEWLQTWGAALDESDAAFHEVERARLSRSQHVGHGEDAEADFVETAIRLRRYVQSRASRKDRVKVAEGERLLGPLLNALKKMKTEKQARATRRQNAETASSTPSPVEPPPALEPPVATPPA